MLPTSEDRIGFARTEIIPLSDAARIALTLLGSSMIAVVVALSARPERA